MAGMEGRSSDGHGIEGARPDPSRMRVSDSDRHKVAEVLRTAAGEGRIDLEELDERLEAAYTAKTYGELVPLTIDLPVPGMTPLLPAAGPPLPDHAAPTSYTGSFSIMSDCTRRGVWSVPERHTAFSMMGSITIDLREAVFTCSETVIDAYAIMAGIDIVVNPSTRVIVDGVGIMGDMGEARPKVPAELTADSPTVRVRGLALMAGVTVRRKEMPGTSRMKRLRG
jgi:hypothetical protein